MLIGLPSPVKRKKTQKLAKSPYWEHSRQQFENLKDVEEFKYAQTSRSSQKGGLSVRNSGGGSLDGVIGRLELDDSRPFCSSMSLVSNQDCDGY